MKRLVSRFGGSFDYFGSVALRKSYRKHFYQQGIGNWEGYTKLREKLIEEGIDGFIPNKPSNELIQLNGDILPGDIKREKEYTIESHRFHSPLGEFLPREVEYGNYKIVRPRNVKESEYLGYMVILPFQGDEGYSFRTKNLAIPLAKEGIVSIIPEIPYCGTRRKMGQYKYFVTTLTDFFLQSAGTVIETTMMLKSINRQKYNQNQSLGITGFSFGGSMGSLVAPLYTDSKLFAMPFVSSGSLSSVLQGVARHQFHFTELKEKYTADDLANLLGISEEESIQLVKEKENVDSDFDSQGAILHHLLTSNSFANNKPLFTRNKESKYPLLAKVVEAENDGFLPNHPGKELHGLMRECNDIALDHYLNNNNNNNNNDNMVEKEKLKNDWVRYESIPGGHLTTFALARYIAPKRLVSGMKKLQKL